MLTAVYMCVSLSLTGRQLIQGFELCWTLCTQLVHWSEAAASADSRLAHMTAEQNCGPQVHRAVCRTANQTAT